MKPLIPDIVNAIYAAITLAIANVFWLGVIGGVAAFVAVLFIRELPLRTATRLPMKTKEGATAPAPGTVEGAPADGVQPGAVPAAPRRPRSRPRRPGRRDPVTTRIALIPDGLAAHGTTGAPHRPMLPLAALPAGTMRRVSIGDLDILLAHTSEGIVATDDRCPHMSAPLSLGALDGCSLACPLHRGVFDLATGDTLQPPTTGGLDADGVIHPTGPRPAQSRSPTRPARRPRRGS